MIGRVLFFIFQVKVVYLFILISVVSKIWMPYLRAHMIAVCHMQATMSLVMEILLSEEHAGPEVRQCLGRLINAIIAVIGPELSPGSSFFSRCKVCFSILNQQLMLLA